MEKAFLFAISWRGSDKLPEYILVYEKDRDEARAKLIEDLKRLGMLNDRLQVTNRTLE